MRYLLAALIVTAAVSPLCAQEASNSTRNAWGIVFAPMNYGLANGSAVETNESYSSLDFGLFYTRFFSPAWSGRLDVFSQSRDFNTFAPVTGAATDAGYFVVKESTIQADVVLNADRRFDLGASEGRVTFGAGLTLSGIHDQTVASWFDMPFATGPDQGTYFKWGWLFEGGMSVTFHRESAIFARLRMQQDEDTFGESDDADIARELLAYGFHVGMEFGF
jgi:hypothetical protein